MKVKYLGKSDPLMLLHGKIYDVADVEDHGDIGIWYRIIDETMEDYIYPAGGFEIVSGSVEEMVEQRSKQHICPACGEYQFKSRNSGDTCPVCGWKDDFVQEIDPEYEFGLNNKCLNEYKAAYESGWRPDWLGG